MAVFFKYGMLATKKYDNLCPDKLVYLKRGDYELDLDSQQLIYLGGNQDPIDTSSALHFYLDLDVHFGRDKKIPLLLNKIGSFVRTDSVKGKSTIETLFS